MSIPETMHAMLLRRQGQPLEAAVCDVPACGDDNVLIRVHACGVCRTDLHVCDGDLEDPGLPLIPGHEIVGKVVATGKNVHGFSIGQRVGVPWLGYTCGTCDFCRRGQENLCDQARFTGYQIDGGYAEYTSAHQHYVFALPDSMDDIHIAPLLCAGLIGSRSLGMTGEAGRIGMYGFGAAAHILIQVACSQDREVYAFTRRGDETAQDFARQLGATWAGSSEEMPPELLDAAILFAPVGDLLPKALRATRKGGTVVCAGIHMSDIPSFPYHILWGERSVKSVANLTRADGEMFFRVLETIPLHTEVTTFALADANIALEKLRTGQLRGAAVLEIKS